MSLSAVGEPAEWGAVFSGTGRAVEAGDEKQWRCPDCGLEGTYDELQALDCPKGKVPYPTDFPDKIVLAEEDHGTHLSRFEVRRMDGYNDPMFEQILATKDDQRLEVFRRLGALPNGRWIHYSKIDGGYIGNDNDVDNLIAKRGIVPEKGGSHDVCCIGFSEREKKWFGWSHRAIFGFEVGHVVKEGDCASTSGYIEEYIAEHPEADQSVPVGFECKTLDDCKRVAIAFAESVG